ncbi:VRR-NUC domain-containing protein [Luteimonas salinilitoris]|uniref:VRR-NUC domain-containing protein n=1 Tax=Luteimonas salinilitoris TaxID=3237697 RepID=A0ABV4HQZ6_9GAMM
MPVPAIIAVLVWIWRIYTTFEAAMSVRDMALMAKEMLERKNEIKRVLQNTIDEMSEEIDVKSSTYAAIDRGGNSTVSRKGAENRTYREYIERRIPFRPAISVVCQMALAIPIRIPRRIRRKFGGDWVFQDGEVKLKQTTASIMFEGVDQVLEWKSPLKAEPNYDKVSGRPYMGSPPTRPQRISETFPFWPRPKGSLAPDLVIVEYRQQSFEQRNVFAAVEIKFPKDWVKEDQVRDYVNLMGQRNKVALLRVPEDCVSGDRDKKKSGAGRRRRR